MNREIFYAAFFISCITMSNNNLPSSNNSEDVDSIEQNVNLSNRNLAKYLKREQNLNVSEQLPEWAPWKQNRRLICSKEAQRRG